MELKPGTQVRVVEGPFSSYEGTVLAIEEDTIQVEAEIFGRKTQVEVMINQIEGFTASLRNDARKELERKCFSYLVPFDKAWWIAHCERHSSPGDLLPACTIGEKIARK